MPDEQAVDTTKGDYATCDACGHTASVQEFNQGNDLCCPECGETANITYELD